MKRWTQATLSVVTALAGAAVAGCVSGNLPQQHQATPDGSMATDSGAADTGPIADGAVADGRSNPQVDGGSPAVGARDAGSVAFSLLVAETPPGPTVPQNLWSGVLRYTLNGDGASLVPATGIDKTAVADPVGLAFRAASSEVFVANRHGNNAGDGVAGSISRFVYDPTTGALTANGTITGNGLSGVTQVAFNPVSGELFAANYTGAGGISRFTFDGQGNASPNGTIGSGMATGANVSPDGKRLYVTTNPSNAIRQFDLSSGTELAATMVTSTTAMQQITVRGSSELYIASPYNNTVYRFTLDASDNLVLKESITGADAPVGIAFSPDGLELFTGGHLNSDIIDRYQYNAQSDTWTPTTKFTAPASLGYFMILCDVSTGRADAGSDAAHD